MTYRNSICILALITAIAAGCSGPTEQMPFEDQVRTVVAATMAVQTDMAATQAPTEVQPERPASIPVTPLPFGEVFIYTLVDNGNLRVNPGFLFQVSRVMKKDTRLRLLGQSPGGEWFNVLSDEGINGWVSADIVLAAYDGPPPPVIFPKDVYEIIGSVFTELGTPVSGIGFAIVQGARRTDAVTDASGNFYAFLPQSLTGAWEVSYVSVACTSNTMDVNCNCISGRCGGAFPSFLSVSLPQTETLQFTWK